jgi:uncharacterized membrane protein
VIGVLIAVAVTVDVALVLLWLVLYALRERLAEIVDDEQHR